MNKLSVRGEVQSGAVREIFLGRIWLPGKKLGSARVRGRHDRPSHPDPCILYSWLKGSSPVTGPRLTTYITRIRYEIHPSGSKMHFISAVRVCFSVIHAGREGPGSCLPLYRYVPCRSGGRQGPTTDGGILFRYSNWGACNLTAASEPFWPELPYIGVSSDHI